MKLLFWVSLLFLSLQANAEGQFYWQAKQILYEMDIYKLNLQAIKEISLIMPINEDEKTERDLAICEFIGESEKSMSDLNRAIRAMYYQIHDQTDKTFLDWMILAVIKHNVSLKGFCIRTYKGEYRDIGYLQSMLIVIYQDFDELKLFLDKYLT